MMNLKQKMSLMSLFVFAMAYGVNSHADDDHKHKNKSKYKHESRVLTGMKISPVPMSFEDKRFDKRVKAAKGSYLVNAIAICANCHSCPTYVPGENPFDGMGSGAINPEGYLAGGVPFGPETSANITPNHDGLPAGLTEQEFIHTMRTGEHHEMHEEGVLEIMPWPIYRNMVTSDLKAIYAYLKSIPHSHPIAGACSGPGQ